MKFLETLFKKKEHVVTRIAPSPTGALHIGTARSALFNYLYAKKHNGKFIVRIEDTDTKRSTSAFEKDILDGLAWLNLPYDELYRQSERAAIYSPYIEKLLEANKAFISKEPSTHDASIEVEVVRLRNEGKDVTFQDKIRGEVTFNTGELGDFVIARSRIEPLYHLAVVIDDHEMGVTHIIRGEDHISNTPRQILIQEALSISRPEYAHIPLILAPDRSKLSKRKGGAEVSEYRQKGYLPEALINYLALLGWNPGTEQEVFSLSELIDSFSLAQVQKGGAIFNEEKLKWFNREHFRKLTDTEKLTILSKVFTGEKEEQIKRLLPVIDERFDGLQDLIDAVKQGEYAYFFTAPMLKKEVLPGKNGTLEHAQEHLHALVGLLEHVEDFSADGIKDAVWEYATREGRGEVLWPMRYALSGREKSPDPFTIASIIEREETLERLRKAAAL